MRGGLCPSGFEKSNRNRRKRSTDAEPNRGIAIRRGRRVTKCTADACLGVSPRSTANDPEHTTGSGTLDVRAVGDLGHLVHQLRPARLIGIDAPAVDVPRQTTNAVDAVVYREIVHGRTHVATLAARAVTHLAERRIEVVSP